MKTKAHKWLASSEGKTVHIVKRGARQALCGKAVTPSWKEGDVAAIACDKCMSASTRVLK